MISKKTDQGIEAKSRKILEVKSREKMLPCQRVHNQSGDFFTNVASLKFLWYMN